VGGRFGSWGQPGHDQDWRQMRFRFRLWKGSASETLPECTIAKRLYFVNPLFALILIPILIADTIFPAIHLTKNDH
jgi:hypothetical protein